MQQVLLDCGELVGDCASRDVVLPEPADEPAQPFAHIPQAPLQRPAHLPQPLDLLLHLPVGGLVLQRFLLAGLQPVCEVPHFSEVLFEVDVFVQFGVVNFGLVLL